MTTDFFIGQSLEDIFLIVFSSFQMTLAGVEFHKTSQHTHVLVTDATSASIWATLIRLSVIFFKRRGNDLEGGWVGGIVYWGRIALGKMEKISSQYVYICLSKWANKYKKVHCS